MTDKYTLEGEDEEICQIACNGDYMGTCEVVDRLNELEKENQQLKLNYGKCRDCKHADLYIPSYTYPFFDPQCKLTGNHIKHDNNACREFELIGRLSR